MRIPYITDAIEARKQNIQLKRQEIEVNEHNIKLKKELEKTVVAMAYPERTMNEELYAPNGRYKTGRWDLPIETLRRQSRLTYWESSEAQALIDRLVQIVVGKGLSLQASPAWDMIDNAPTDTEQRQELIKNIETRWRIYSNSKNAHYLKEFNVNKIVQRAYFNYLLDGEFFAIFRYQINGKRNPLTIELIAPESVKKTTSSPLNGNTVTDGIEYNSRGIAVAYHICDLDTGKSVRVPAKGARSGRTFVVHKYHKVNERQRRGVPLIAGSITEFTRLSDTKALEAKAMAINAILAVWVKPPEHKDGEPVFRGKAGKKTQNQEARASENGPGYNSSVTDANFDRGGMIVDELPAGHSIESFDTKRPNTKIIDFSRYVKDSIYASKGAAPSVVDYNFKSNYTAARGELIIQWEKVMQERLDVPAEFLSEIYSMWLWGEIDSRKVNISGYYDEEIREAWSHAVWKGTQKPDVDPEKSATAHRMERDEGWKTNQQITAERDGGDFDDNIRRTTEENKKIAEAREPLWKQENTNYSNNMTETEVIE